MRRLRFSRKVVVSSFFLVSVMIVSLGGLYVVSSAGDDTSPGVLGPLGVGPRWSAVIALMVTVALAWLTLRLVGSRLDRPPARPDAVLYGSFGLLLALFAVMDATTWSLMIAALWWSIAALVTTRRRIAGFTLVLVALLAVRLAFLPAPDALLVAVVAGYTCFLAVLFLVCNLAVLWLWEIAREATLAREARARLAVSEERLRFARDMHDLLGHSLSGIAVKSELAARLAERDPGRAAVEMAEVQRIAREALREVRTAVSGYRNVDLADELASVRSVLTAAGVHTTVTGGHAALPEELRPLAAWIAREGATNVLRHSSARRCDITLAEQDRACVVEVYNDGVRPGRAAVFGNGLTGLSERTATVGGTLSAAGTDDGGFLLRAVFPVRGDASPRQGAEAKEVAT
ncbi:sensor histidine kinase [Thermobifida halotolerans]|uniref:Sensor histidine kinase n=3 Tax=Thermobifida halotolerans TaxID=483545 RepID=A0AA97M1P7_9ACTN|nr:sensor histidine kinase [Thermobifida halotolerans]